MIENKLNNIYPYSFSREMDFMFTGEYLNGTLFFEYNPDKNEYISVKEIQDRNNLLRFGTVGHGIRIYFDIPTGSFYIDGNKIDFLYKIKDKEYTLTNNFKLYNDLIYFKNVYSDFNTKTGYHGSFNIYGYNLGYETKIIKDDIEFYFKPILNIAQNQPMNFQIRLVSNKDLDGEIVIKVNNLKQYNIYAPLQKNEGGQLTWIVRN
ncbi:hypothetical protein IRP62_11715 (plasmid) [Clostridium botulinum]|uniref:hypothetical protein n=1 Tax=Clostridium botulinum C phage TaxID=12336 RepID=UPI00005DB53C|nr:hypothetical protein [Clostridium botulinum]YP_398546.1 hypothetical protein CST116 [Clostridium phage c-st]QPW54270.1 hypothetical protein IRP62_11715 [Clostridium botulinum]BAE47814.1 hypothetical protein CST116 [Clostridium phage c-st]